MFVHGAQHYDILLLLYHLVGLVIAVAEMFHQKIMYTLLVIQVLATLHRLFGLVWCLGLGRLLWFWFWCHLAPGYRLFDVASTQDLTLRPQKSSAHDRIFIVMYDAMRQAIVPHGAKLTIIFSQMVWVILVIMIKNLRIGISTSRLILPQSILHNEDHHLSLCRKVAFYIVVLITFRITHSSLRLKDIYHHTPRFVTIHG